MKRYFNQLISIQMRLRWAEQQILFKSTDKWQFGRPEIRIIFKSKKVRIETL